MLVGIFTLALITSPALASVCSSSDKKDCKSANDWEKRGRNVCEEKANYLTCLAGKGCFLETSECHDLFDPCKKPLPAVCFAPSDESDAPSSSPSRGGGGGGYMAPEDGEQDYLKYPPHAPFFGFMGAAAALVFANMGAAYGTAKSGRGISTMGVLYPSLVMKHIIPVVMAGVLGIYGLIIAVIIGNGVVAFKAGVPVYSAFKGFAHLGGGLACGLSGLAAGMAIGIVGDYGVRSAAEQPKLYVGMVLVLIFSEALGLYGLIVGLILTSKD